MKIVCIIPSRLHSTRLPRKPLLPIQGKPMVQWTYENAKAADFLSEVIVATDDPVISKIIHDINGQVVLTDPGIKTGSERVAFVAQSLSDADIIINLQGDEPFIRPSMLKTLVQPFMEDKSVKMTTLAYPLLKEEVNQPGVVKVITDINNDALYFSRSPIPFYREEVNAPVYHHMGLYAFTRDFLMTYATLPETPLGQAESLEQLRVLEHGYKIRVCLTNERTLEINTPEEYEAAQAFQY